MKLISLIIAGLLLQPSSVQEEKVSIWEAKYLHEKELLAIPGVKWISVGGIGDKYHLVISVESKEVGEKVLKKTGGSIEGWPIHISVSRTSSPKKPSAKKPGTECHDCICPCHKNGKTVVKPPKKGPDPNDPEEACDVLRRLLKKKLRRGAKEPSICRQMVGWTNDPKKVKWVKDNGLPHWDSKEFGSFGGGRGNTIAYTYIRHRLACPLQAISYLDRVKELTPGTKK